MVSHRYRDASRITHRRVPLRTRVLITGPVPGRGQAAHTGQPTARSLDVTGESGAAWFEAAAGTWTLTKL